MDTCADCGNNVVTVGDGITGNNNSNTVCQSCAIVRNAQVLGTPKHKSGGHKKKHKK